MNEQFRQNEEDFTDQEIKKRGGKQHAGQWLMKNELRMTV